MRDRVAAERRPNFEQVADQVLRITRRQHQLVTLRFKLLAAG
jgi:hypothetical protein